MDFSSKMGVKLLFLGLEDDEKKNVLTSPLSYNAIINMLAAGSSGDTLDQILRCLQHKNIEEVNTESSKFAEITCKLQTVQEDDGEGPVISLLNGVWVNKDYCLKDSFQHLLLNLYKAKVENIDCEKPKLVVQETNEWASASTKGLVTEVLKEEHITPETTLIIGNALYFKGSWEEPFKKGFTRCESFYLLNGREIQVPFMKGCKYSNQSFESFHVVRIPYSAGGDVDRKFAMYIFLPNEKGGLKNLLDNVDSNPKFFERYCDPIKGCGEFDILWIPKFKFSYSTEESVKIMKHIGLTLPFDREKAEFSEMIKDEDLPKHHKLSVSKIIQKTFIEVNEEGTEAAAATFASTMYGCCMSPPPPTEFIVDHPFVIAIREEKSGILFFLGTILNPLED